MLKNSAIKNCEKTSLKTFKKFLKKRLKNTRPLNILRRRYKVEKRQYEYSINTRKTKVIKKKGNIKIDYKLAKQRLKHCGVTLRIKAW